MLKTAIPLLALLASSALALPVPGDSYTDYSDYSDAPSCKASGVNGTTFTTINGSYQILCNLAYTGGDLSNKAVGEFGDCLQLCDSTAGCVDVTYTASTARCYLKNSISGALATSSGSWTAKQVAASASDSCPALNGTTYTSSTSLAFQILCGTDLLGQDLSVTTAGNIELCMEACSNAAECVSVSYTGNTCYLKTGVPASVSKSWVTSAFLPTAVSKLTCDNKLSDGLTYKVSSGGSYTVVCGTDYAGGDLSSKHTTSFSACVDLCDATSGCVDVAFTAPTCYLKKKLTTGVARAHVWSAKKVS